jgi:hypothetical protein
MDPGTVRTEDQMRFDVGRVVSLGAHVSMGDHRHPDGTIDPEVYSRLGAVYADVEAAEPWLDDAKPCTEAVLLTEIDRGDPYLMPTLPKSTLEAARMLEEIGLQFDIVSVEEKLPSTDLVIWPGASPGTMELVEQLKKHVERGGSLLAMGAAADSPGFADAFGIKTSPCERENDFVRAIPELGVSTFAHVMTTAAPMIDPDAACITLADRLPSASLRPPCAGSESMGPAVVQKGRVVYSGAPLFVENALSATPYPREVLEAIINRLLEKRLVRHDAGNTVAAHLLKSKHGYTLHLLHWAMERWPKQPNPAASFPNIGPVKVTLRVPERVSEVTLEPGGSRIDFAWSNGTCTFTVPHMKVWQMVGIKTGS